jgi:predicted amidohydrolase
MSFRLAAVQPRSFTEAEEHRNVDVAMGWLDRAGAAGADLVVFPEGFPGPTNPANYYEAMQALRAKASELKLHVVANGLEPAEGGEHYVSSFLIDDTGSTAGSYRRTTPAGPYLYRDIPAWDFDYAASPQAPRVIPTRLGKIGILTCSEVYVPELSRILALQGADLIVYPSGGAINELLPTWRAMVWARAIENLVYTTAVQNIYSADEQGVGTIASPEAVVASATGADMLVADVDTDRLAFLRERDERIEFPKPYQTPPGLMRWRRPELYGELAAERAELTPRSIPV